jgi:putative ABC transport system ATP-binding protein
MLELVEVCKQYPSPGETVRAVDGVSAQIKPGEFLAIYGPSGSGKSTLLSLIGGLLRPDSGIVRYRGSDLATLTKREILAYRRFELGLVFQSFELIEGLSAQENVSVSLLVRRLGRREVRERTRAALDDVGMLHRAQHTPHELSGGEQQRVAIARALVGEPKLMLADEPTGNLDSETGEKVLGLFRELVIDRGVATVLATHDPQAANYADRVLEMRDGGLAEADLTV